MNDLTLAIDGGVSIFPDGPPTWPIADDDILYNLQSALADGSWGKYDDKWTESLVHSLSNLSGTEHVMLCSSGTIAVEVALRAVDVKAGDEVILAAYDFPGNFRAIEAIGARPVIVDVVAGGWVIDIEQLQDAITEETKAVIGSHLHGQLLDCKNLRHICDDANIKFIEDVCQCPGATLDGISAGSFGDVSVYSFGGSKLLSAGRGGAIATNNPDFYQRAKIFCNRGNEAFPLSQLQAAALLPQIDKLKERNLTRLSRSNQLNESLSTVEILKPINQIVECDTHTAIYKLPWLIETNQSEWTRDEFIRAIQAEGVAIDVGFRGFTRRSSKRCRHHGSLINSRIASQQTIILHHPVLLESEEVVDLVAVAIAKVGSSKTGK